MENKEEEKYLLKVENLTVGFEKKGDFQPVIQSLSFELKKGEILGIVGESGSGKSMTALSIMGLLPKEAKLKQGRILYHNQDLISMDQEERRKQKGKEISMIFQEPMTSLNPVLAIGRQVKEMLWLHSDKTQPELYEETISILKETGLNEPEKLYHKYPHELSGGMRQRVMIAMAMICRPNLMIADEPTTALDVTIQKRILELIKKFSREFGTTVILISHDLGVIKSICSRALVMKDGTMAEMGTVHNLFYHPQNAYTQKLLKAVPRKEKTGKLLKEHRQRQKELETAECIMWVKGLSAWYPQSGKGFFSRKERKQILKDISFELHKGEILGIVGESGSGKTTLAKVLTGLVKDREGRVWFQDAAPDMVFQDPYGSLNPARTVEWILEEPLKIQGGLKKEERQQRVKKILEEVGLKEKHKNRYISQLSGGQRQRVSIACAFIRNPKIVILDEPVSALDVTVQAQILKLLLELREKYDLSYLFISHDLNVIYQMCDRVGVMYHGELVELAGGMELYKNPVHPYTRRLLSAIPEF